MKEWHGDYPEPEGQSSSRENGEGEDGKTLQENKKKEAIEKAFDNFIFRSLAFEVKEEVVEKRLGITVNTEIKTYSECCVCQLNDDGSSYNVFVFAESDVINNNPYQYDEELTPTDGKFYQSLKKAIEFMAAFEAKNIKESHKVIGKNREEIGSSYYKNYAYSRGMLFDDKGCVHQKVNGHVLNESAFNLSAAKKAAEIEQKQKKHLENLKWEDSIFGQKALDDVKPIQGLIELASLYYKRLSTGQDITDNISKMHEANDLAARSIRNILPAKEHANALDEFKALVRNYNDEPSFHLLEDAKKKQAKLTSKKPPKP